jgi:hypothetical protein
MHTFIDRVGAASIGNGATGCAIVLQSQQSREATLVVGAALTNVRRQFCYKASMQFAHLDTGATELCSYTIFRKRADEAVVNYFVRRPLPVITASSTTCTQSFTHYDNH